jgi:hypothetical protein
LKRKCCGVVRAGIQSNLRSLYDHIVHWGIDLLLRRSYSQWERRCWVPLLSTAHLRFETNSRSGTKYGGRSQLIWFKSIPYRTWVCPSIPSHVKASFF